MLLHTTLGMGIVYCTAAVVHGYGSCSAILLPRREEEEEEEEEEGRENGLIPYNTLQYHPRFAGYI